MALSRYLPLLFATLVLGLWSAGCFDRARGNSLPTESTLSKQAIVALVAQSLSSSGMPEPPLRRESTRTERKEYLSASEQALAQLSRIGGAKADDPLPTAKLLLPESNLQVLTISKMLAVELADSIDRSDAPRAIRTIQIADDYVEFLASRSVPDWLASAAVADTLAVAVKSVADQLDEEMATSMATELAKIERAEADPAMVLKRDAKRISAWLEAAEATDAPVAPESVPLIAGVDPDARMPATAGFLNAVKEIAPNGAIAPEVFRSECRIAADQVISYLREPRGPLPGVDSSRHPVASFLLSILHPTYSQASELVALRAENWRLLALTAKVAAADLPEDLSALGDLAKSPVSNLPFEYAPRGKDFDIIRPRVKAGATP